MKPRNLGEIKPPSAPSQPSRPLIPPRLRLSMVDLNIPYETAAQRYGIWQMIALKPIVLGFGRNAEPGDTFSIPGNDALMLALDGGAKFANEADIIREDEAQARREIEERRAADILPVRQAPHPRAKAFCDLSDK